MNGCTFCWFLLLALCEKSISRKLPISRNWYMTPLLWPVDSATQRLKAWPPSNTRYGKYFRNNIIPNAHDSILIDQYRSNKNDLKNLMLRNTNLQFNRPQKMNQSQLLGYNLAYDFQPSYLQQPLQLLATKATVQTLKTNPLPDNQAETSITTYARKPKYCRRDSVYAQKSPKLLTTQAPMLPSAAYSSQEYNFQTKKQQSLEPNIKEKLNFKPMQFSDDNSHSFFTLNDAVTPSIKSYQEAEKEQMNFFTPTLIPTTESESKFKPIDYNESIEPSDSNTSTQRLLPLSTERTTPVLLTTENLDTVLSTESSPVVTTILPTVLTTTVKPKQLDLNSTKNSTESNKRYVKKLNKTTHSTRLALQKSGKSRVLPPRIKLKSKNEFFRQVRYGKVQSSQTPLPETQSNTLDYVENTTMATLPVPTSTKPTRLNTKHVRFQKNNGSTIATRLENNIQTSRRTETRTGLKQRNLKRFFRKSNIKNEANKTENKLTPAHVVTTAATVTTRGVPQKRREQQPLKVEKPQNVVKSTQSTIMKISANKNSVETTKHSQNLLETGRQPKEAATKTNVQPLPIEIFFQKQQASTF